MNIRDIKFKFRKSLGDIMLSYSQENKIAMEQLSVALLHEAFIILMDQWNADEWTEKEFAEALTKTFGQAKEEYNELIEKYNEYNINVNTVH